MADSATQSTASNAGGLTVADYVKAPKDWGKLLDERFTCAEKAQASLTRAYEQVSMAYHGYIQKKRPNRANFFHYKLFPQIQRSVARKIMAYWRSRPFTNVLPTGSASVDSARLHEKVLQHYIETCPVYYLEVLRWLLYSDMFGWSVLMPTWKKQVRTMEVLEPIEDPLTGAIRDYKRTKYEKVIYDGIWYRTFSPSEVYLDPHCHGLLTAQWCGYEEWVHIDELLEMTKEGYYDEAQVNRISLSTEGQNSAGYRLRQTAVGRANLDPDKNIVRLRHLMMADRLVTKAGTMPDPIRNTDNPLWHQRIPGIQGIGYLDPDSPYPMAPGIMLLPGQKMVNMMDNVIGDTALQTPYPVWWRKSHIDAANLVSLPNHSIEVENKDDVGIFQFPETKQNLILLRNIFSDAMDETVGYFGTQQGNDQGQANTATSDAIFQGEGNKRISADIQAYENLCLIPKAVQESALVAQMAPDEMEIAVADIGGPAFETVSRDDIQGNFRFSAASVSETINESVLTQQLQTLFEITNGARQLVRIPATGEIIPVPVGDTYGFLKKIAATMGLRDADKLLLSPTLFGEPVSNDSLAQSPPTPPSYLEQDPRTGRSVRQNPDAAGGGGGRMPGRSLNPGRQVTSANKNAGAMVPTASMGAY